jgi:hypothetical protein
VSVQKQHNAYRFKILVAPIEDIEAIRTINGALPTVFIYRHPQQFSSHATSATDGERL